MSKNVVEISWHTFRFLAFPQIFFIFLVISRTDCVWCWLSLVLAMHECSSVEFYATSTHRRKILIRLSSPGTGGRKRLCKVLWTAWVERMISGLATLARRTLLKERHHSVLIMSCHQLGILFMLFIMGLDSAQSYVPICTATILAKASPVCKYHRRGFLPMHRQVEMSRIVKAFSFLT